jgi:hypothetical protein
MLKIPTFIIGGLLILTGIAGYLLQDPGVSLKLKGPLAEDTQITLSDGNQTHELDLGYPSSDAAGEHAYWIIYNLNLNHAKDASQGNYAVDEGGANYEKKSFWYASSKGDSMKALQQESENFQGAGNQEQVEVDWSKVDTNSSTVRFVFKNQIGSPGPITLQVSNWKNIDITPTPKPNEKIEFKKSWTAFIPGILGIILILLTLGADKMPKAQKHFMHVAVLVGLVGFIAVAGKVGAAVAEMSWLKEEPFMIIHVSSLKPTTMLLSAGLLLIFVILCIVSFIEARKNRIAEEKKAPEKSITSPKTSVSEDTDSGDKKDSSKGSDSEKSKEKTKGSIKSKDTVSKDSGSRDKQDSSSESRSEKGKEKSSDLGKSKDSPKISKTDTPSVSPKPGSTGSTQTKSPTLEKKGSSQDDQSNESKTKPSAGKPAENKSSIKPQPPKDSDSSEKKKNESNSTISKVAPISKPENSTKEAEVKKDETDSSNKE